MYWMKPYKILIQPFRKNQKIQAFIITNQIQILEEVLQNFEQTIQKIQKILTILIIREEILEKLNRLVESLQNYDVAIIKNPKILRHFITKVLTLNKMYRFLEVSEILNDDFQQFF
ncbi:unnamed protein product [Paramecium octaurelia]|uniref:Uncharacterized protein n=1 Tax=Paramecium octaurelia TaxID=43137 RepID=A0A8S1XE75_PAROT|nr:unnamed protein product [Paramecium octaurelia]